MHRIESPRNQLVLDALRAVEHGESVLLEGERTLAEALDAGIRPETLFAEPGADPWILERAERAGARVHEVSRRVIDRLSGLVSARGVVALAPQPSVSLDSLPLAADGLALYLDGVQDPANVGAILRSAEAFGAAGALLSSGCAHPFSARALRASAGSALRVPIALNVPRADAVAWARARGATVAGADAHGGSGPAGTATPRPLLLAIGSEGQGLSAEVAGALDVRLTIPLLGRVESLNAAVAAGILLYALSAGARSRGT